MLADEVEMVAAWASSGGWSDRRGCAVVPLVGVGRAAEEVVGRRTGAAAAGGGPRVDQRGGEVVPRTASDGRGAEGRGVELGMKPTLTLHLAIVCVCVSMREMWPMWALRGLAHARLRGMSDDGRRLRAT